MIIIDEGGHLVWTAHHVPRHGDVTAFLLDASSITTTLQICYPGATLEPVICDSQSHFSRKITPTKLNNNQKASPADPSGGSYKLMFSFFLQWKAALKIEVSLMNTFSSGI